MVMGTISNHYAVDIFEEERNFSSNWRHRAFVELNHDDPMIEEHKYSWGMGLFQ